MEIGVVATKQDASDSLINGSGGCRRWMNPERFSEPNPVLATTPPLGAYAAAHNLGLHWTDGTGH